MTTDTSRQNIFAVPESDDFGKQLVSKLSTYTGVYTNGTNTGAMHYFNVTQAYAHTKGLDVEGQGANAALITRSGNQGSVAQMRVPVAASMLSKCHAAVVGPELAWSSISTNSDYASVAANVTAKTALQYYWNDKGVGALAKRAAHEAFAYGEVIMHVPWDPDAGEQIQGDENTSFMSGDIDYRVVSTWDILRDPTAKSWDSLNWVVIREWRNRYTMEKTTLDPEAAKQCLNAASGTTLTTMPYSWWTSIDSDLIPVYFLYHKQTPSVPTGRQTVFLENGTILHDSVLDKAYHKQLPVIRMSAGHWEGTPFPYSKFWAALGAQQALDKCYSNLLTSATAFARGILWSETDYDFSISQLGGGPKHIVGGEGTKPPILLQLQPPDPTTFQLINQYRNEIQQIMGLDELTAGNNEAMPSSGALAALMTSTTIQNNSPWQSSWVKFVNDIGSVTLAHIQYNMTLPRKIALAGKARSVQVSELSSEKVEGVERILVSIGNPMEQTTGGRFELAQLMAQLGMVKNPQELQSVLDSGRTDEISQDNSNELMLIADENERLARGEAIMGTPWDAHQLHIQKHASVTSSVEARRNPDIMREVSKHIDWHMDQALNTDPRRLQMLGQPVPPPEPMPEPAPQKPQMSPATKLGVANAAIKSGWAPTPQAAQAVLETGNLAAGSQAQQQQQAQAPSMPINPLTKERVALPAGLSPALAIKPLK